MEILENNSAMMRTVVETFLIEETIDLVYDNEKLDEWKRLVSELGLEGQECITKPNKSPIPFMHLKKSMVNVFETICPVKVNIKKYDKTPIPLEILNLVLLSEREHYFNEIQIWYDDKTPDPVCLGIIPQWILHKQGSYTQIGTNTFTSKEDAEAFKICNNLNAEAYHASYNDTYYLLGKWADVKHSFDELKRIATERFINEQGNSARDMIEYYNDQLRKLESNATKRFN